MSREADMAQSEKMHDRNSVRRELAKTLRKFVSENEQPVVDSGVSTPAAPAAAPEKMHDRNSVRRELAKSLKRVVDAHAAEMAKLRERELAVVAKSVEVVDSNGKHKTIGAKNKNPAPPTKPVGMDEGSGGVIVPGKKLGKAEKKTCSECWRVVTTPGADMCNACGKRAEARDEEDRNANPEGEDKTNTSPVGLGLKRAEPPMAKPPSGSVPGKTVPQSSPGGAPAVGAPKSSAMPTAKGEMCEHGVKKGESCAKCMDEDGDYDGDGDEGKPKKMKKGDFGTTDGGKVATTPAQAAGSAALAGGPAAPPRSAAGIRGTPATGIKVPGRTGTAGLVSPKMGAAPTPAAGVRGTPALNIKVPGRGPAAAPTPAPLGPVK